jgi:DNA-binding MarR family transcriptional regulator
MIDRLEKNELVRRRPHPSDRRSYVVALTEKGHLHHAEHHQMHLALTREITSTFTDEEISELSKLLKKLIDRF